MAGHCPWVLVWTGACYWHGVGGFLFNSLSSAIVCPGTPRARCGPHSSLLMECLGCLADMGPRCGSRLCRSRRSSGDWRTGVSPHHTMACSDVGGRVTDGADSPAAAGSSDCAKATALQLLPGWRRLRLQTWMALATANGQALWVGGRREEAKGGTRRCRDTAFAGRAWNGPCARCGRGGIRFPGARTLGGSSAR